MINKSYINLLKIVMLDEIIKIQKAKNEHDYDIIREILEVFTHILQKFENMEKKDIEYKYKDDPFTAAEPADTTN